MLSFKCKETFSDKHRYETYKYGTQRATRTKYLGAREVSCYRVKFPSKYQTTLHLSECNLHSRKTYKTERRDLRPSLRCNLNGRNLYNLMKIFAVKRDVEFSEFSRNNVY